MVVGKQNNTVLAYVIAMYILHETLWIDYRLEKYKCDLLQGVLVF